MPIEKTECPECNHAISLHADKYGCDFEADRYESDFGPVAYRCGCKAVDRLQASLQKEYEHLAEQFGCPHNGDLEWSGYEGIFRCGLCGSPLVVPELGEHMGLEVATE